MKKLTIKEILELDDEKLEKMMSDEQFNRMKELGFTYTWQFLDALQDSAKASGQKDNEEHVSIDEYLDYLEDMKD